MKVPFFEYGVICLLLLTILFGSCKKEDYTLPVDFKLSFAVINEPIFDGALVIDELGLELNAINIQGYREQGNDVFLTRIFEQGKSFTISPVSFVEEESFDIPQGVYNPISFSFTFQPDEEESDLIDDLHDWLEDLSEEVDDLVGLQEDLGDIIQDYLDDLEPSMVVKGKFTYNGRTKHVVVVVNDPLTMQIHGKSKLGSSEVSLNKNAVNHGTLHFDPTYWFSVITAPILDDAFTGLIDGEEYIFLSKYVNGHVYSAVFNRIEESTVLTINE